MSYFPIMFHDIIFTEKKHFIMVNARSHPCVVVHTSRSILEGCLVRAAYTKESGRDRVKLSSLHGSGNVSYYKQGNKVITIPSLHGSGNEGIGENK
jgi:hypothetical protein